MKLKFTCPKCREANRNVSDEIVNYKSIPKDFTLTVSCKRKHQTLINFSDPLFSILYDKSVIAYFEENYSICIFEAVRSLERFYEHAIRVLIIGQDNLENQEAISSFNDSWKIIKNMSERQIGAFVMLFHKATNRNPFLLSDKLIKLRNDVIHKGYLPEKEEALDFLTHVCKIIQSNRLIIKANNEDIYWLLDQRIDYENFKNSELDIVQYSGPHFFNSSFGLDFNSSLKNYYIMQLK